MYFRPWPLVILAIIQCLNPITSVLLSAWASQLPPSLWFQGFFQGVSMFTLVEVFLLPWIQGLLIFFAKRWGFYVIISITGYILASNIREASLSHAHGANFLAFLVGIILNLGLIVYFFLPSVRSVYFRKDLRWWESLPRYKTNVTITVENEDHVKTSATLVDLSLGGAGVSISDGFINHEDIISLLIPYQNKTILMRAIVVYGRSLGHGHTRYGLEWVNSPEEDRTLIMKWVYSLEKNEAKQSRSLPSLSEDFLVWFREAKRNPKVWVPRLPKSK